MIKLLRNREEPHVPAALRALHRDACATGRTAEQLAALVSAEDTDRIAAFRYFLLAEEFTHGGSPLFVLSHSVAAALTATRAPSALPLAHSPFPAFLIEVPSEFLPIPDKVLSKAPRPPRPKRWISVITMPPMVAIGVHSKGVLADFTLNAISDEMFSFDDLAGEAGLTKNAASAGHKDVLFEVQLAYRLALNTISFVTTHRENVAKRKGTPLEMQLLDVSCPKEVRVDRVFREHVLDLISARTVLRARGVLAHLVRGHWKRSGRDKELLWIAPYRRGDENIGEIVMRTEHVERVE